ncbi:MAG: family 20 glycosylhydrolase [Lachnospiraceae bacterium]|nr:family 20 glycosylhydrolase [Lachnospiraceae bacterium]
MKHIKKILSGMLVLCMLLSLAPATVLADEVTTSEETSLTENVSEEPKEDEAALSTYSLGTEDYSTETTAEIASITKTKSIPLNTDSFYKIFHLDAGRKYFSVDQIKDIIDIMAANDYNTLELAVGNDGMRFLLDDMSVTVNGTTYSSDVVKAGIQEGNKTYCDCGTNELTQAEMDTIIEYANSKGISIIPLINSPGHMDAILTAANKVTETACSYNGSARTIDVTNATAVNFTLALVNKYIQYFAGKGCTVFNMGCDEYANDIYSSGSMGFGNLVSSGKYSYFIDYVNDMAAQVQNAGMTAMAFNDGFYFNGNTTSGTFDTDIVVAFWSSGWSGYTSMSASNLAAKGHKIINTNGDWYYILGTSKIDDVTSNINKTAYNSVMGSGTMEVAGSMLCFWCDTPAIQYSDSEKANLETQLTSFAAANTAVFDLSGGTESGGDTTVSKESTVNVTVGQEKIVTVSGANYAGTYTTDDPSVATVEVTGKDKVPSEVTYKKESGIKVSSLLNDNSDSWRTTDYYYTPDNGTNYYPLYVKRSTQSFGYRTYTYGYSIDNGTNFKEITTQTVSIFSLDSTNVNIDLYTKSSTEETPATTTITFKAVGQEGTTTYVDIGDTRYTINIVGEDLSNVSALNIEYWITNGRPADSDNNNSAAITAEDAYSEDGVTVTTVVPENTVKEKRTLQYWRCRLLNKSLSNASTSGTEEQTETAGDDDTYNGVGFTKVRYWNGSWAVYTENNEWINVETKHQLVAYYLEILPVADELTVTAADWGKKGDGSTSGDYLDPLSSCTVSVQVVYEDGTTNPASTEAKDLNGSTIAYGYWSSGRGVGTLNLTGLEGYQIWKVEAETGSETYASSSSTWGSYTVDSFTWDNNAMTVYEGDPVDSYIIHNDSNNPSTDGYYQNLMWDENYEAILIKVYVKAKPTDQNLKVVYYDEKFDDELYSYNINVDANVDFSKIEPKPEAFNGNAERIDVTGCGIINTLGVKQMFQTDLTQVPEAIGKYNSELYSYTGSVISEDRKTLYLYYNINTEVLSPMFVADFGLKIEFPLSDVVQDIDTVVEVTPTEKTRYGTLTYDASTRMFTYTPTKALENIDVLTINILFDGENAATTTNCGVMPATTVYYEEGFADYTGDWSGKTQVDYSSKQATQIAGKSKDEYGYDKKYSDESPGASNGTQTTSKTKGDKATFTFVGTGIDIYANTTTSTGKLFVSIKNSLGETVKNIQVDTKMKDGSTNATVGQEVNGYNVPVVSLDLGTRDTYTVKISHVVSANEEVQEVNLDGFRVYGTIAEDNDYYYDDKEDNPSYIEMRDQVLSGFSITSTDTTSQINAALDGNNGAAIVASSAKYSTGNIEDLLNNGPKNEIYLQPEQALVFQVTTDRKVQIGLKALNASVSCTINNEEKTINSSTDMFYEISSGDITITNKGNGILAITKLKICDDPNASFKALTAEDLREAMIELGIVESEEPVEPEVTYADAVLNIILNDSEGKELASTTLTAKGIAGESHTFSAAEVEQAVGDLMPDGYELKDAVYEDVEIAYGESDSISFKAVKEVNEVPESPANIFEKIINVIKGFFKSIFGRR